MNKLEKKVYQDFYLERLKLDPTLFDLYPKDFSKYKKEFPPNFNYQVVYPNYLSDHYIAKNLEITKKYYQKVQELPETLNSKIFKYHLENDLESFKYSFHLLPISQVDNPYADISEEASGDGYYNFELRDDYVNFLERVKKFQVYSAELRARLEEGLGKKITIPRIIIQKTIQQLQELLSNKSYHNENAPKKEPNFNAELDCLLGGEIKLTIDFLENTYLKQARRTLGLSVIDPKMYLYSARSEVDLPKVTIEEIYKLGLREVHRVDREMMLTLSQILDKTFKGRTDYIKERDQYTKDPKNYFSTSEEAKKAYQKVRTQIQNTVMKTHFSGLKVSHNYSIKAIPEHGADYHSAYYYPPNQDLTRKGTFYLNSNRPKTLLRNEVLGLSLHEGNPGHHFQLTYQLDHLKDLPDYAKVYSGFNSYVEGWGLYVETLGNYTGKEGLIQKYGQLNMEMLRSLRLVLDTGIHHYGWTLGKARKYYQRYSSDSVEIIDKELLRYVADPGQALSYKMGQLTFLKIQKKYLDDGLLLKHFHKECFERGEMPLFMMEEELEKGIKMKF